MKIFCKITIVQPVNKQLNAGLGFFAGCSFPQMFKIRNDWLSIVYDLLAYSIKDFLIRVVDQLKQRRYFF